MPISISEPSIEPPRQRNAGAGGQCEAIKAALKREAEALGFDAVRVTSPDALGAAGDRLMAFLAQQRHGDMAWMEATAGRRRDPSALWPKVRSIIMLGASYAPAHDPLEAVARKDRGVISVYAQGRDYHDILKGKLKRLAVGLERAGSCEAKVFVDTAPLMEKPLAAAAGIGWQGKHTNLVSRGHGSWLFLGAILTDALLAPDPPELDHCGSCRRCLDICPTDAFPQPYQLDARRCIAYLTIEYKGHIAPEFRAPIGNRIFGCDDCLAVCPWNKFAAAARETRFAARAETDNPPLAELLVLDDARFRKRYAGTPLRRTGRDRFLRNVLIGAGNSRDTNLLERITPLLADASPLVRAMAVWALKRLADGGTVAAARSRHIARENDGAVRAEWHLEPHA